MPSLTQTQEQQAQLNQTQNHPQFSCNICNRTASQPVVTKCGHLFWYFCSNISWQCVHNCDQCNVCSMEIVEEDFVPIYTHEEIISGKGGLGKVKPKPKARQIGKIKNSASLGSANEFSALFSTLNDNIHRQNMLAGNGYCPTTLFTLLGQHDEDLQEIQIGGKSIGTKITALSWLLLFAVLVCLIVSLRMDKDSR